MVLLICGAGQYGLATRDIADDMGIFSQIIFLDDKSEIAIGKLNQINNVEYDVAVVAIGNPAVRENLFREIKKSISIIHPRARIMSTAKVGEGSIIEAGAIICSNAEVGRGVIVMSNVVVGHNAKVEDFCQLKYNCTITENSIVPRGMKIDCNVVY